MLEPLLVQTLQNTHYFHAVVTSPFLGQYDYMLKTEILDLRQDYSQGYRVFKLSIRAQLIRTSTGRVIATKLINVAEPMPACTPYSGVQAGNRAVARALREIAVFSTSRRV
jgi:cholesterol transport system auxiliary component